MKNSITSQSPKTPRQSSRAILTFSPSAFFSALLLFSILATPSAFGAVSFSQGVINSESDVLNPGTLVLATDLGAGAPAVTVNGVVFGSDSSAGLTGFVHGDPGDFSNQFPSGSPLDQLLSELDFQNLGLGSSSLTLSGLTPGTGYLFQIFLSNILNTTAKSTRITIQGQAYDIADFGNNADYIRATFTASGSSEVIQFGNGSANESDRMIINAFALSTNPVPEPGALALGAVALVLVWATRRTRKASDLLR